MGLLEKEQLDLLSMDRKIKIFYGFNLQDLELEINKFISDKLLIDCNIKTAPLDGGTSVYAYIIYEE